MVDGYLVVATDEFHLAEDDLAGEVGRKIVDPWDRVPVNLHGTI